MAERQLLHVAVGAATKHLIVSFPNMDLAQGRSRVPSLYALEIARAVEGRIPKLHSFELETQAKAEARLTWPAPLNPLHSIDNGEYDLAWYRDHVDTPGACTYLKTNQYLYKSLLARYERWDKKWTSWDGLVLIKTDAPARKILGAHRLDQSIYSASSLQHFAACPYRFYLYGIYGLKPRENVTRLEQLDPLTRGALFHAVQFRFFQQWRQRPDAALEEALGSLDIILDSVAEKYEENLAPAIPRVWRAEIEELRIDLREWLRLWYARLPEWEPLHFELAFGLGPVDSEHDSASNSEPVVVLNRMRLRGSIDLIEQHRSRPVLRVIDHKTGKRATKQAVGIGGGSTLQPALYAVAAETLLGKSVESGRLEYCTQRGGYTATEIKLDNNTRQYLNHALDIIQNSIESAFLPAAPQPGACSLCDYRLVCGPHEELRVKKWKPPIEALDDLRRLP